MSARALLALPGHVLLATEGHDAHLLASLPHGGMADVLTLFTAPSARRRGHGQALMAHLISEAKAAGCVGLTLEVRSGNAPARALYEAMGLRPAHVRPGYYASPVEDAVVYTLMF